MLGERRLGVGALGHRPWHFISPSNPERPGSWYRVPQGIKQPGPNQSWAGLMPLDQSVVAALSAQGSPERIGPHPGHGRHRHICTRDVKMLSVGGEAPFGDRRREVRPATKATRKLSGRLTNGLVGGLPPKRTFGAPVTWGKRAELAMSCNGYSITARSRDL